MKFFAYIIYSGTADNYYIGHSSDFKRRVEEHNDVENKSWASKRGPWEIVATKKFSSRSEAMKEEKFLKSLKNRGTLLRYIENTAGWRRGIPKTGL